VIDDDTPVNTVVITETINVCAGGCGGGNDSPVITFVDDVTPTYCYEVGTSYSDPSATASDTEDGDLTSSIIAGGDLILDIEAASQNDQFTRNLSVTDSNSNTTVEPFTIRAKNNC